MNSKDGQVIFDSIGSPYYRGTFTELPMNPFSIILFGYLGEINREMYDKYIELFKDIISKETSDTNGKTYAQTLLEGSLWMEVKRSSDPIGKIMELSQEENSSNYLIYYFISDFFKLNVKVYLEEPGTIDFNSPEGESGNLEAEREIYLFSVNDMIYPILVQEIDGSIRVLSILF